MLNILFWMLDIIGFASLGASVSFIVNGRSTPAKACSIVAVICFFLGLMILRGGIAS